MGFLDHVRQELSEKGKESFDKAKRDLEDFYTPAQMREYHLNAIVNIVSDLSRQSESGNIVITTAELARILEEIHFHNLNHQMVNQD